MRCLHEAKMHKYNAFITLTYDDAHLPKDGSLCYRDFQLFMKRLRKCIRVPVRFFMCGEYGETTNRPHYHVLLFGYQFSDLMYWGNSPTGHPVYRSAVLETLWTDGNSLIGDVSRESAGYVARYCMKKVTGDLAEAHYNGRVPEFARMSLKPGIGAEWFLRYGSDCLPCDYVVADGMKVPVPRFYDKLFKGDLDEVKYRREVYGRKFSENNSPERLAVREEVAKARIRSLIRNKVD